MLAAIDVSRYAQKSTGVRFVLLVGLELVEASQDEAEVFHGQAEPAPACNMRFYVL
jgi:hypothetical protein